MIKYDITPPQANNLSRVISLLDKADGDGKIIFDEFNFSNYRDINYYSNALRWLGLANKVQSSYFLTNEGRLFRSLNKKKRIYKIREILLSDHVFSIVHKYNDNEEEKIRRIVIQEIIKKDSKWLSKGKKLGITTAKRRASTVISWSKQIALISDNRNYNKKVKTSRNPISVKSISNLRNDNENQLEKIKFAIKELTKSEKLRNSFTVGEITKFCENKWSNWKYPENTTTTVGSAVRRCLQHHCSDSKYGGQGGARTAIGLKKGDKKDIFNWEKEKGLWSIRNAED